MANVALALGAIKPVEQFADGPPQGIDGFGVGLSQHRLELGKHLLIGVEVRAVGQQVLHRRTSLLDRGLDAGDFVGAQLSQRRFSSSTNCPSRGRIHAPFLKGSGRVISD